jgi:aspartate racemase
MNCVKTLGILGGMGPAATAYFLCMLVAATPAGADADHIPVVAVSDPRIPDRTDAYLNGRDGEVLEALHERLTRLERLGADAFAMPCNSAHYWADALKLRTALPLIHVAEASLDVVATRLPQARRIAVIGTPVTLRSGFYQRHVLARALIWQEIPDAMLEGAIMPAIRAVKAGRIEEGAALLRPAVNEVIDEGADAVLLACSEIPLALDAGVCPELIDTNAALAQACVTWALAESERSARRNCPQAEIGRGGAK